MNEPSGLAASGQRRPDAAGQPVAMNVATDAIALYGDDVSLSQEMIWIAKAWANLPCHIQDKVLTLIDVGLKQRGFDAR